MPEELPVDQAKDKLLPVGQDNVDYAQPAVVAQMQELSATAPVATVDAVESLAYSGQFPECVPVSPETVNPRRWPADRPWAPVADEAADDKPSNAST